MTGVDLLLVAFDDFDAAAENACEEWRLRGFVTPETRLRHGRTWRWLCHYVSLDGRDDAELPSRARMLRHLLRLQSDDARRSQQEYTGSRW